MGADFIEPDLVSTKDHVLVARHENEISRHDGRGRPPRVRGAPDDEGRSTASSITGWFTEDFTLARAEDAARQGAAARRSARRTPSTTAGSRCPPSPRCSRCGSRLSKELGRTIGVYPETKHPTYFRSIGLPLEAPLVRELRRCRLDSAKAPVFVQSFELTNLVQLRTRDGVRARLVFLTSASGAPYDLKAAGDPRTYADLTSATGLRDDLGLGRRPRPRQGAGDPAPGRRHARHRPPHSCATPTRPGSPCTRTRSATRTPSCRPTTGSAAT